jgi:hypothetical protein
MVGYRDYCFSMVYHSPGVRTQVSLDLDDDELDVVQCAAQFTPHPGLNMTGKCYALGFGNGYRLCSFNPVRELSFVRAEWIESWLIPEWSPHYHRWYGHMEHAHQRWRWDMILTDSVIRPSV